MADNRERREWLKIATLGTWVNKMAGGGDIDPMTLIPPALQVQTKPVKLTEEQEKAETRAALMLMGECLKAGL